MKKEVRETNMDRRAFLHTLSQAVGYTAAASVLAGSGLSVALAYSPKSDSASRHGLLFSQAQMKRLASIADTILPATDTKSASAVDVHGFVDHQLVQCHNEGQQQTCVAVVDFIESNAKKAYSKSFIDLDAQQQTKVLRDIEALKTADEGQKGQFKFLKSLIVFGYFTTEEGVTKALSFQPFPGGYKGSIPVEADTKVWGSLNYY
ncbi:gluconate 2-dehydrogenase subunit 3 family protein [Glaciecola siphonariae]|uniref:Gluconate 2-dehydrogenase subunit 3 family protein n=1 Tax=Glaciecola siphonariae TaxID=521012 RepID=A0ABV9LZI1_9ALTE